MGFEKEEKGYKINYILTYVGNKDEFQEKYLETLNNLGCTITGDIEDNGLTIVVMQYQGAKPGALEEKLGELDKGKLFIEKDAARNWIPESDRNDYNKYKKDK
ncbi:MAG: hypothetical protein ACOCQX_03660 [Candidatus Nanoarchaeia archaeon]